MAHHRCDECGRAFINKIDLTRHKLMHTELKAFKCDICQSTFIRQCALTKHIYNVHKRQREYKCNLCGVGFTLESSLTKHKLVVHTRVKRKSFVCKVCGKTYTQKQWLRNHMHNMHDNERIYKCNVCDEAIGSMDMLNAHMESYHGKKHKSFVCNVCGGRYAKKRWLRKHMHNIHKMIHDHERNCDEEIGFMDEFKAPMGSYHGILRKSFVCKVCGKMYFHKKWLRKHMHNTHDNERNCDEEIGSMDELKADMGCYHGQSEKNTASGDGSAGHVCRKCGMSFATKPNLARHMLNDACMIPRVCQHCKKTYAYSSTLKNHVCTQARDLRHKCKKCPKSFNKAQGLTLHMRMHSQAKHFTCGRCDRSFIQKFHLKIHRCSQVISGGNTDITPADTDVNMADRIHTCTICKKSFSVKSNLKKHMAVHHFHIDKTLPAKADDEAMPDTTTIPRLLAVKIERIDVCTVCQKSFADMGSLQRHMTFHRENNQIACNAVKNEVSSQNDLPEHGETPEEDGKPQTCTVCSKAYVTISDLRRHMAVHDSDTRLECAICEEFFPDTNHLVRHMQIHTWENAVDV